MIITKGNEHPEERVPLYKGLSYKDSSEPKTMTEPELLDKMERLVAKIWCRQILATECVLQILDLIKEAGYVRLHPDQSLPIESLGMSRAEYDSMTKLIKAGWRKMKEEKE